jgi:hypothetical protein
VLPFEPTATKDGEERVAKVARLPSPPNPGIPKSPAKILIVGPPAIIIL